MKLFEVKTTEHNGEQKYWASHIVAAKDVEHARSLAREYFEKWYADDAKHHASPEDPDRFEFMRGHILLEIDSIAETTFEDWMARQVELRRIGKLPKAMVSCKRCQALLSACQYIRDCLDVGGEQSRQFAEEIACLKKAIREAR